MIPRTSTPPRCIRAIPVALVAMALLTAAACGTRYTRASRLHAKPWTARLVPLFDDQNDICTPWVQSTEIWANNEQTLHTDRAQKADIVALGVVRDVVNTSSSASDAQVMFHFQVTELLRGTQPDLPDESPLVVLTVSKEQEKRITKRIIGKKAVLFLRWVKGGEPPFRWHVTCASSGVAKRTREILAARKRSEAPLSP